MISYRIVYVTAKVNPNEWSIQSHELKHYSYYVIKVNSILYLKQNINDHYTTCKRNINGEDHVYMEIINMGQFTIMNV